VGGLFSAPGGAATVSRSSAGRCEWLLASPTAPPFRKLTDSPRYWRVAMVRGRDVGRGGWLGGTVSGNEGPRLLL
jgi:hypothetical protein